MSGPFVMMEPLHVVRDEGLGATLRFVGRLLARRAYVAKMGWLMRRLFPSLRHLGYVVVAARKPG